MSRGVPRGRANPLAGVGPRRRRSPVEGRSARRGLRAAPAAAGAGPGWSGSRGSRRSRARASLRARPADHEPPVRGEQPRRAARRAARLSPSRGEPGHRALRGEVSPCRVPRGGLFHPGAPPPPPPLGGRPGKFVGETYREKLSQALPLSPAQWAFEGRSGRSGDRAAPSGPPELAGTPQKRPAALRDVRGASLRLLLSSICPGARLPRPAPVPLLSRPPFPVASHSSGLEDLGAPLEALGLEEARFSAHL